MEKETRQYITNNGYVMMLPATDERVMTIDELTVKYNQPKKSNKQLCPKCHTSCGGDCQE